MQQSDYDNFTKMLGAVSELYARPAMSAYALAMWWGALREYDLDAVRQALDRHVKNPDNGQFVPKPADVIRMMGGTSEDSALVAWAKVDKAIRQVGTYASVAFDDPLIHRAIFEMGGWVEIGSKDDEAWPFVGKEFQNRYRGYKMRNERPEYPPVLIGMAEAQNDRAGFRSQPPILIGDSAKAQVVMLSGTTAPLLTMAPAKMYPEVLALGGKAA